MGALSKRSGAHYIHVLQPNLYFVVSSSKVREVNPFDPDYRHRRVVENLYPKLQRHGGALATAGIHFIDATDLFDKVPGRVYSDICCHYNQRGNELLADLLAERIRPWMAH